MDLIPSDVPMRSGPCHCRLCLAPDDRRGWDRGDHALAEHIRDWGWHLVMIQASATPAWTFTVGMSHTLGVAEAVMFGLSDATMGGALNNLGASVRAGRPLRYDEPRSEIFEGHPAFLKPVDPSWNHELFGYAHWLYGEHPPMVQVVWSDLQDRFPWDDGFDPTFAARQPELWNPIPDSWPRIDDSTPPHFLWQDSHSTVCITDPLVAGDTHPVLLVVHEEDDTWQALSDEDPEGMPSLRIDLSDLLDRDPTLLDLQDLPAGWMAERSEIGRDWVRRSGLPE